MLHLKNIFIYLATPDLSCSTQDLCYIMWKLSLLCTDSSCTAWAQECVGSVVPVHELCCSVACGILAA